MQGELQSQFTGLFQELAYEGAQPAFEVPPPARLQPPQRRESSGFGLGGADYGLGGASSLKPEGSAFPSRLPTVGLADWQNRYTQSG